MAFDSEGNLYVTIGDSNSSQSTNGYSGNYQPQRCPTGDPTQATNAHCGSQQLSFNDARRTAGNTNDYNGKMLRFNPIDSSRTGRSRRSASARPTRCRRRPRPTARTCSTAPRAAAARPSPRSTPWACATRRAWRSTPRPTSRTRRGSARTPAALGDPGPVDVRDRHAAPVGRQLRLAVLHGQQAGLPRPHRRRLAAHHQRGRLRQRRPGVGPDARAGTTATTSSTTRRTTPASRRCRTPPARARTPARRAPNNVWYTRGNPGNGNGCPEFPREQGAGNAPNYGGTADPAVPVPDRLRRDGVHRPGLPLQAGHRQLGALAEVLGRPLVPERLRQRERQARAAAGSGHRSGRLAADLRGQLPRRPRLGRELHGLEVRSRRRALRPGLRGLLHRPAPTSACTASTTPAAPTPRARTRSGSRPRPRVRSSSRSAPPAASPTSGTSATARRRPTRREPAHTYADARHLQRQADGDLRRRREGEQDDERGSVGTDAAGADDDRPAQRRHARRRATPSRSRSRCARPTAPTGTGVEWTEHRVDGGAWIRADNTANAAPFVTKFTVSGDGTTRVEYRSRDKSGNIQDPAGSVTFAIDRARRRRLLPAAVR